MPLNLANAELAGLYMQRMGRDCKKIQQVLLEEHFFFPFLHNSNFMTTEHTVNLAALVHQSFLIPIY